MSFPRAGKIAVAQAELRVVGACEQVLGIAPVVLTNCLRYALDVSERAVCATQPVVEHGQRFTLDPATQLRHRGARIVEHQVAEPGKRVTHFLWKVGVPGVLHPLVDHLVDLRRPLASAHLPAC